MAFLNSFGSYLPSRVVTNEEMGELVGCTPEWIVNVSGIEERRFAADDECVEDMAACAARDCLDRAGIGAESLSLILVSSGTSPRQFPGPAAAVAQQLGLSSTPAIDLPLASAGSLFGLSLAHRLAESTGNILVVASEKMSTIVNREPVNRGTAILFGDGAGACLVSPDRGFARMVDSSIQSDGSFTHDLKLDFDKSLEMNGRSVILQASRKLPRVIAELLERNRQTPEQIQHFVMHQANQNLIDRVADALGVPSERFFSNIRRYGNTSSASMLIAAKEWLEAGVPQGTHFVFAAFGAGFHWGAVLAEIE